MPGGVPRRRSSCLDCVRIGESRVGVHSLKNDRRALAVALPFGCTNAATLSRFARLAAVEGASDVETAPNRMLLTIGMKPEAASRLSATAGRIGIDRARR